MFTGLIEDIGRVTSRSRWTLTITVHLEGLQPGDSLAVNGVCLTLTAVQRSGTSWLVSTDLSEETLRHTTLGRLNTGDPVNLERALRVGDRFGGHIVLGHVDTTVRLLKILSRNGERLLYVERPVPYAPLLVEKGSVALDGVSLTIASVSETWFSIAIIPTTWRRTTLGGRRPGDTLNLECDVLARYTVGSHAGPPRTITLELLRRAGFLREDELP